LPLAVQKEEQRMDVDELGNFDEGKMDPNQLKINDC
jgi:hypothetical protein